MNRKYFNEKGRESESGCAVNEINPILAALELLIQQHDAGSPHVSERVYMAACSQADYLAGKIRQIEEAQQ